MTRLRAIAKALYYGIAPWWIYEPHCHYEGMSYWAHLGMNLRLAFAWATFTESDEDRAFEQVGEAPRCEDGTIPTDDPSLMQAGVAREPCPGCPKCQPEQVGEGNDAS